MAQYPPMGPRPNREPRALPVGVTPSWLPDNRSPHEGPSLDGLACSCSSPWAVVLDRAGASAPVVFLVAALAIIPLAGLIVRSTEQVAERTGPAIGGLLNATF